MSLLLYQTFSLLKQCSTKTESTKKFGNLEDMARYPGAGSHLKFTSNLDFVDPQRYDGIPVYRVSSPDGKIMNPDEDPKVWSYVV